MFNRKNKKGTSSSPQLQLSIKNASKKIAEQIKQGEDLLQEKISNDKKLHAVENRFNKWNNENFNLLKKIFNLKTIAEEYASSNLSVEAFLITGLTREEKIAKLHKNIEHKCQKLRSINSSLEIFEQQTSKEKIYFLHATDSVFTRQVMKFLQEQGFELLLMKQFSQAGSTIFDTIQTTGEISKAVIVLNPESESSQYPDQNLLLELGIFVGLLGRENVIALRESDTIVPEDYHGFHYINSIGGWQQELKSRLQS